MSLAEAAARARRKTKGLNIFLNDFRPQRKTRPTKQSPAPERKKLLYDIFKSVNDSLNNTEAVATLPLDLTTSHGNQHEALCIARELHQTNYTLAIPSHIALRGQYVHIQPASMSSWAN
eukprot:765483-Hanusia_phi.AAC.1